MAIKGKGRTRTKQPVRAPRRGPVPVPVPFARRRSVHAVAAFIAGLLVFWGGVWLTNGLREQDRTAREEEQELLRRRAGSSWQSLIETEVGTIGTVQEGSPPAILPEIPGVLSGLADGTPKEVVATLRDAATKAATVSDAVESYALASSLSGKGFDSGEVLRFLSARDELLTSIDLIREAVLLGAAAARLDIEDRVGILDRANSLLADADAALARFQTHHVEALSSAGINPQQPTLPGLPGA
jgi:hypothetical protein